jgi:hypothetical protein
VVPDDKILPSPQSIYVYILLVVLMVCSAMLPGTRQVPREVTDIGRIPENSL